MVKCVMNFFYSNLFVLGNVLLGIEAILGHHSGPSRLHHKALAFNKTLSMIFFPTLIFPKGKLVQRLVGVSRGSSGRLETANNF